MQRPVGAHAGHGRHRRLAHAARGLEGIITPSSLHFERHHNGVPDIDPAQHQVLIHGLVERPLMFSMDALARYPLVSRIQFLECSGNSGGNNNAEPPQQTAGGIHGLVSCSDWTGVPLAILLEEAGVKPEGKWLLAEGADAAGDEPQRADGEGHGRRDPRDLSERRAPAARATAIPCGCSCRATKAT